MSRSRRIFWLMTLALSVGGCSSYMVVPLARVEADATKVPDWDMSRKVQDVVRIGDWVRLTLIGDETVEGRIAAISSEALTLEPEHVTELTNHPENLTSDYLPRVIGFDQIRVLEVRRGGMNNYTGLAVLLLVVVVSLATADFSM